MNKYNNAMKSMIPSIQTKNGKHIPSEWSIPSMHAEQTFLQQQPLQPDMSRQVPQKPMHRQASQAGMYQPRMPETGIFQPDEAIQPQPAMQQNGIQTPTTIMASGRGVRDSVLTDTNFTQGFLRTQIGRHVKIEFLIGTNMFIDREGDLVRVGTDYIIIQETATDDYLLCDLYSIKFIRFYY